MLLKEKTNQETNSDCDSVPDAGVNYFSESINQQRSTSILNPVEQGNWETISPINLIKLIGVLAISSVIMIAVGMNNLSCGVNGNHQSSSQTWKNK